MRQGESTLRIKIGVLHAGIRGQGSEALSTKNNTTNETKQRQRGGDKAGGSMKVVSICTMRYNRDTAEPVMLSQVNELASFGFFQRQG